MNARKYTETRALVDKLLSEGWSITGRDPLRLECCGRVKRVIGGMVFSG